MLVMSDIKGKPRLLMQVTADGAAKLEFLDEAGKLVYGLPSGNSNNQRIMGLWSFACFKSTS